MKILYIDKFSGETSNSYWKRHFAKHGELRTHDIRKGVPDFSWKPNHIHMGGSVKNFCIPPKVITECKRKFKVRVTVFYGDAKWSSYHAELAEVVDAIYISNKTFVKRINKIRKICHYLPCPTDPSVFRPYPNEKKRYEVIFIGNSYSKERREIINEVSKHFKTEVFGGGWKKGDKSSYKYCEGGTPKHIFGKEFAVVCSRAKIAIGTIDKKWSNLEAYFSNRLTNTMACGCFYIVPYTPGIETVFMRHGELVWYKDIKELLRLIRFYLKHDDVREKIAKRGMKSVVQRFSYGFSVKKIMGK